MASWRESRPGLCLPPSSPCTKVCPAGPGGVLRGTTRVPVTCFFRQEGTTAVYSVCWCCAQCAPHSVTLVNRFHTRLVGVFLGRTWAAGAPQVRSSTARPQRQIWQSQPACHCSGMTSTAIPYVSGTVGRMTELNSWPASPLPCSRQRRPGAAVQHEANTAVPFPAPFIRSRRKVVRILKGQQARGLLPRFKLVELNGMRLTEPHQVKHISLLFRELEVRGGLGFLEIRAAFSSS